jgi:hypothetical protein
MSRGIKPEPFRGMVELLLSDLEGVEFFIHVELLIVGSHSTFNSGESPSE